MRLVAYRGTRNLGDAIQTIAMRRFLESRGFPITGYSFRQHLRAPMCVNGWHRHIGEELPGRSLFVGVHSVRAQLQPLDRSSVIGARDPWTAREAEASGLRSILTGCVTSTLPRYTGPRKGLCTLDWGGRFTHSNQIPVRMAWSDQLRLAEEMLGVLARSELVVTRRLHALLPCLALGTPVLLQPAGFQPERFSLVLEHVAVGKVIDPGSGVGEALRDLFQSGFEAVLRATEPSLLAQLQVAF